MSWGVVSREAFDLPTQMGHDSDAPIAHGEVGKVGVA
ncbi:methylmalonyl-CoA mutase family protein, partial [Streptomyces phaeochromogenes]